LSIYIIYWEIALPHARVVVDDITNEMPVQDMTLKWLKVAVSSKTALTHSRNLLIPTKVLEIKL